MQSTMLYHDDRSTEYLINHDHKLIIWTTGTVREKDCDVQVYHTNHPEIKVIIDSEAPDLATVKTQPRCAN